MNASSENANSAFPVRFLVSCFEPFLQNKTNPTQAVAEKIARAGRFQVETICLPVVYGEGFEVLHKKLLQGGESREGGVFTADVPAQDFDCVVMLGLAQGRDHVQMELFAHNLVTTRAADNAGVSLFKKEILRGEPLTLQSPLPLLDWLDVLPDVRVSSSAGGYVCNELYYRALHQLKRPCVFIHIPDEKTQTIDFMAQAVMQVMKEIEKMGRPALASL